MARENGILEDWHDARGFGFIRRPGAAGKIYVHMKSIGKSNERPQPGDKLTYEVGAGANGRPAALKVRIIEPPPLSAAAPAAGITSRSGTPTPPASPTADIRSTPPPASKHRREPRPGMRHISMRAAAAATIIVLITMIGRGVNLAPIRLADSWSRAIAAITPPVLEAIKDVPGPIYISDGYGLDGSSGLDVLARAELAGLDVRRSPSWAYILGAQRTINRSEAATELLFLTGSARIQTEADPYYREIFTFDPQTPEERSEFDQLVAKYTGVLDLPAGTSRADETRAREALLQPWVETELSSASPSEDFRRYLKLLLTGEVVSVFISNGPPR